MGLIGPVAHARVWAKTDREPISEQAAAAPADPA